MKKILFLVSVLLLSLVLSCGKETEEKAPDEETAVAETGKLEKLIVGATSTPHGEILEQVKEDLKAEGIELEIKEFEDYILPNKLLGDKELDANYFQHIPYMEEFAAKHNLKLVSAGKVHIEPLAIYSKKITKIEELADGATVLVPNDPTNGARGLLLLDKVGVIKLKDNTKLDSTVADIAENPKNLKIVPLNAEQIPSKLSEVDAAAINSNFAIKNGLNPSVDSILIEDSDSKYTNIVTVLEGNENDPRIQKLIKALQSEKIKKFIEEKYKGAVIPAF